VKVFVSRPIPPAALSRLEASFAISVGPAERPCTREELLEGARAADAIVTMVSDRVDGDLLDACPGLRLVANFAVGLDNVDLEAARQRRVMVTHTPGVLTEATAELAFALLLAVARRLVEGDSLLRREGRFPGWAPLYHLGRDVHGTTLGIVGMGRIGAAMARRARAFGMRVLYAGPPADPSLGGDATRRTLPELLAESDHVSLHCPLRADTRHIIDAAALALMRPHAALINTARGALVDEAALVEALRAGTIGGAGLDVFEREPAVHDGLRTLPGVVLAPHIGSATVGTRAEMARLVCEDVEAVLAGRPAVHPAISW
jgi:glyoxylate reductase